MTDLDRLCVLMYQTLMHMENELDEQVQNRQHILAQMPTPSAAIEYRDALLRVEVWKEFANRVRSVLDFFKDSR